MLNLKGDVKYKILIQYPKCLKFFCCGDFSINECYLSLRFFRIRLVLAFLQKIADKNLSFYETKINRIENGAGVVKFKG
jgi:hypothetical protein